MYRLNWILALVIGLFFLMTTTVFLGWRYMSYQIGITGLRSSYSTAEEAMVAKLTPNYDEDADIQILHAGPNLHSGKQPYVWYVIAEVRASARADGSRLGHNGCDAPGSFFLQTRDGWVYIPEGAFPHFVAFWMDLFGLSGPGEANPTTDWAPDQPKRFCQSPEKITQ